MPNQPLQPDEIEQCKGFLGYPQVSIVANPIIGTSRLFEDVLAKYAGDKLVDWIRNTFLPQITQIDADIYNARSRYEASKAGPITLNPSEHRALIRLRNWLLGEFTKKTGIKPFRDGRDRGGEVY